MKQIRKPLLSMLLAAMLAVTSLTACGEKGKVGSRAAEPRNTPAPMQRQRDDEQDRRKENPDSIPEDAMDKAGQMLENEEGMIMAGGLSLRDIVTKLGEDIGIVMPQKLEDKDLEELLGVNRDDVEEYYGEYSSVGTSADHIIGVKAKKGKVDAVKSALESRKEQIVKKFEEYLPEEQEKARCGKVIQKGNYLFLVIAGDKDCEDKDGKIEKIIDDSFQDNSDAK